MISGRQFLSTTGRLGLGGRLRHTLFGVATDPTKKPVITRGLLLLEISYLSSV